ncbi:flippase [Adhaeribacter swui]|uniref:Flippase n=1 Tax=Adhaeribacter swui TaxID=2086471 RepID=A0A7G7G5A0_9BACT|nr:flippase [Adhaeribacter swui]QNF32334.1 flippase [Adhaeribacter swui]
MEVLNDFVGKLKNKQKIIFNSIWVIGDKLIRMFGGLIVGIWVARYLGPFNLGALNYALSIIAICVPIISLGLNNIVLTELIKENNKGQVVFTSLILRLFSGSIICFLIFLFSFTLNNEPLIKYLLIILSFQCIFQSSEIFDIYYQSLTESKKSVIAKSSAYIIINIIKVFALLNGSNILIFGLLSIAETFIAGVILTYFYLIVSRQTINELKFDLSYAKNLLSRSWPLIISDLFIIIYMRIDQLMIKNMVGNTELGRYSAAVRLSEIHYFLAGAICISVYPSIIQLKEKNETDFLNAFQKLFNILCTISVVFAIIFTFFSDIIVNTLYGIEYNGVGGVLAVHIWTGVFVFLGVGSSNWFIINNLQRHVVIRTIIGLSINIILNIVLIPEYQAFGAAIATLIAQMFAAFIANSFTTKTRVIFNLQLKSFLVFFKPSIKNYI